MKRCDKCGEDDQGAFYPSQKQICKPCHQVRTKAWWAANPEKKLETDARWARNNAGKANAKCAKRRAKRLAQTPEDANIPLIRALYTRATWLKKTFGVDVHVDHIKPLSKGGEHTMGNLQLLPAFLNIIKGDKYE